MYKSGRCVWITGLPGRGKSLIARVLLEKLESWRIRAQIVSSDMLRRVITPVPKYTEAEFVHVYVITYAVYGVFHDLIDTRFYKKM